MNVDGAFILSETRRKTSVLLFVESRFINDSDESEKMFVARIALAHAFKKNNTNLTEQLMSNSFSTDFFRALDFEPWHRELVQRCLNNLHAIKCHNYTYSLIRPQFRLPNIRYIPSTSVI